MNGGWGLLFKIALACFPVALISAITLGTWIVRSVLRHDEQLKNTVTLVEVMNRENTERASINEELAKLESRIEVRQREILATIQSIKRTPAR